MKSSVDFLRERERLRVGQYFLSLRPKIAVFGAIANALLIAPSRAPIAQKVVLGLALGGTVLAFFVEAYWLKRRALTEAWLFASLVLTLIVLASGAALSGGMQSPILPLLFAPVVVGFAAFARSKQSSLLFVLVLAWLIAMSAFTPLPAFPPLPAAVARHMLLVSSVVSLALLAVGVIGLVDAHARIALELERMRTDMLSEAERRVASFENLSAQVAHEVKNPLTAVRGLVQLVQRKAQDDSDQKRLAVVITEVDRALNVLKDYLSFAKPLSQLSRTPSNLKALLEDVAGVVEARAHELRVKVVVTSEDINVPADRQRLRDAVLNLALNAIAAMPNGGNLELRANSDQHGTYICVIDDGAGMSAEMLAHIGEPFTSGTEGGTGLGVVIARAIARQHGGELRFESELGKGTRATLELPRAVG